MDLQLDNKVILVTGSSSGIGYGIAKTLLDEGASVIITGRNEDALKTAYESLLDITDPSKLGFFAGDLTDKQICTDLAGYIRDKFATLNHLVCNIGSGSSVPPLADDQDEWRRVFDINLFPTIAAIDAFLPLLKESAEDSDSNSITLIGSICGHEALGCPLAYAAAKSALASYVKNASRPLGVSHIRLNAVIPGNILFDGSTWDKKLQENPDAVHQMLEQNVPLKKLGSPQDIANAVAFLASSKATFVTGANWVVDGGQTRS